MSVSIKQFSNPLMKACIVHHNHTLSFKAWNEGVFAPAVEYIPVDVFLKGIKRKQHLSVQSANDVGAFSPLPVMAVNARCANRCIAIRSDGLSLKTTLVHIHNRKALSDIVI